MFVWCFQWCVLWLFSCVILFSCFKTVLVIPSFYLRGFLTLIPTPFLLIHFRMTFISLYFYFFTYFSFFFSFTHFSLFFFSLYSFFFILFISLYSFFLIHFRMTYTSLYFFFFVSVTDTPAICTCHSLLMTYISLRIYIYTYVYIYIYTYVYIDTPPSTHGTTSWWRIFLVRQIFLYVSSYFSMSPHISLCLLRQIVYVYIYI